MGFFDFFKKDGTKSKIVSEAKIQKQVAKVREKYAKTDYRQMAMDNLLGWNTKESLRGVLERFCVVVDSPGADEAEKTWLVDELVKRGAPAKAALESFIQTSNEVAHAIVALEKMLPPEEVLPSLLLALAKRPPMDHRLAESKVELIAVLRAYLQYESAVDAVSTYLDDHHDDVQLAALDALFDVQKAQPSIARLISDNLRSARVLRHAAKIVTEQKIPIRSTFLAAEVEEEYEVRDNILYVK